MIEPSAGTRIYFDTNVFIEAFEGTPQTAEALQPLFMSLQRRPKAAVASELTLAELLGRVSDRGWLWQKRFYLDLVVSNGLFDLQPITRDLLIETGEFRKVAKENGRVAKLADSIHALTAVRTGCRYVFNSDRRFYIPHPLSLIAADADGIAAIRSILDA